MPSKQLAQQTRKEFSDIIWSVLTKHGITSARDTFSLTPRQKQSILEDVKASSPLTPYEYNTYRGQTWTSEKIRILQNLGITQISRPRSKRRITNTYPFNPRTVRF